MDRQAFDFGLCFAICANWSSNHHCRKKPSSIITCSTLRGQKRERSHIVVVRCHQTCACCGAGHSLALALHSKSCVHRVCCHVAMDGTCALLCVLSPSAFSAHGHARTTKHANVTREHEHEFTAHPCGMATDANKRVAVSCFVAARASAWRAAGNRRRRIQPTGPQSQLGPAQCNAQAKDQTGAKGGGGQKEQRCPDRHR